MSEEIKTARTIVGEVVSDKSDKTIVVFVERKVKDPVYGKYVKRSTKFHAHDPQNQAKLGDSVRIKASRPYSKQKSWELVEIVG